MINKSPLSPHLSIHKKVMTALFSIFHRISGIGLSLGTLLIVFWIAFLALGPKYFNFIMHYYTTNLIFKINRDLISVFFTYTADESVYPDITTGTSFT